MIRKTPAGKLLVTTALAIVAMSVLHGSRANAQDLFDNVVPCDACGFRKSLFADTRGLFADITRRGAAPWRSAARDELIVLGAMASVDRPVRDHVQAVRNPSSDRIAKAFEPFGEKYAAATLLGFALAGRFSGHTTARSIALDGTISSVIASGLVVPALKEITGRERPRINDGAADFDSFRGGGKSFPSGHTAEAFALAASIAENYDRPWVKGLCYGVASLVGYARIEHDAHWVSDTTAGAFIGIAVAKSVSRADRARRGLALTSAAAPETWGLSFAKAF
jgi:membrane-associated phospholipid phosphatase